MTDPGYVYALTNPAYEGSFKIGKTRGTPEERAKALSSSTGVMLPFEVYTSVQTEHPDETEKVIHSVLSKYRISGNREFFSCDSGVVDVLFSYISEMQTSVTKHIPALLNSIELDPNVVEKDDTFWTELFFKVVECVDKTVGPMDPISGSAIAGILRREGITFSESGEALGPFEVELLLRKFRNHAVDNGLKFRRERMALNTDGRWFTVHDYYNVNANPVNPFVNAGEGVETEEFRNDLECAVEGLLLYPESIFYIGNNQDCIRPDVKWLSFDMGAGAELYHLGCTYAHEDEIEDLDQNGIVRYAMEEFITDRIHIINGSRVEFYELSEGAEKEPMWKRRVRKLRRGTRVEQADD